MTRTLSKEEVRKRAFIQADKSLHRACDSFSALLDADDIDAEKYNLIMVQYLQEARRAFLQIVRYVEKEQM